MHLRWKGDANQKQYIIKYSYVCRLLQLTRQMSSYKIEELYKLNYEDDT